MKGYDSWKTASPWDYDYPCELCGEMPDYCICPECRVCGDYGNPECYIYHGLKRDEEQKFSLEVNERRWELENKNLDREYDSIFSEEV